MCGIHLIVDKKNNLSQEIISKMTAVSRHRGPDSTQHKKFHFNFGTLFLGANRLKITDQSEFAAQPYISSDQNQALLFNGEIYNFYELKNILLGLGVSFSSKSDTEVLFHWLKIYGRAGITDLKGMFAFIFIDLEKNDIFAARDRFGIKPLYYFEDENYFIASSEIKAILSTGLVKKEINPDQVYHYLAYKYAKPPETFYQNIYELTHGFVLHFDERKFKTETYFNNKPDIKTSGLDIEVVESLITDSLLQQINAEVPLGLLLSGGVDSTLLLALAKKEGYQLPTYSIVNTANDRHFGTNDYLYSRLAATTYGSDHYEIEMNFSSTNQFEEMIELMDQPIGDSAYLLTSEICKNAKDDVRILLSGAGADELFAGYNRHGAFHNYLKHKRTFNLLSPVAKPMASMLPSGFPHPLRKKFKHLKKFSAALDSSPLKTYHNFLTFSEMGFNLGQKADYPNKLSSEDWFSWALKHDQNNYLVSDVLALSDKASMLHSIELRVPYLDENLVQYLNSVPAESLIKPGQKWVLKKILSKYGGQKFANRPKEGLGLPLTSWLENKNNTHLMEIFQSSDSIIFQYLDKQIIDKLADQQKRKAEDHGPLLWSVLVLAHWLEQHAA